MAKSFFGFLLEKIGGVCYTAFMDGKGGENVGKKVGRAVAALLLATVIFSVVSGSVILCTPYTPAAVEEALRLGQSSTAALPRNRLRLMSFNTGHGALGAEADEREAGGRGGRASTDTVIANTAGIYGLISKASADVLLLQDVDVSAHRTHFVDQSAYYGELPGYAGALALDYNCRSTCFFPPYARLRSGLLTLAHCAPQTAQRYALPSSYGRTEAALNARRCVLACRYAVENSEKKLTVIQFAADNYAEPKTVQKQLAAALKVAEKAYEDGDWVIFSGSFCRYFGNTEQQYPLSSQNIWNPTRLTADELPTGWKLVYDTAVASARLADRPYAGNHESAERYVGDGFVLSPNVDAAFCVTVDQEFRFSTHNPVLLEVSLN